MDSFNYYIHIVIDDVFYLDEEMICFRKDINSEFECWQAVAVQKKKTAANICCGITLALMWHQRRVGNHGRFMAGKRLFVLRNASAVVCPSAFHSFRNVLMLIV